MKSTKDLLQLTNDFFFSTFAFPSIFLVSFCLQPSLFGVGGKKHKRVTIPTAKKKKVAFFFCLDWSSYRNCTTASRELEGERTQNHSNVEQKKTNNLYYNRKLSGRNSVTCSLLGIPLFFKGGSGTIITTLLEDSAKQIDRRQPYKKKKYQFYPQERQVI